MKVVSRTLSGTAPKNEQLEIALLIPFSFKNKLRTIPLRIFEKIKNNQLELKYTGSYKKRVKLDMKIPIL